MTQAPLRPPNRNAFKIALICALTLEADMVESVFDEHWDTNGKNYGKVAGDQNVYSTGAIGNHNVVLAYMSGMGGNSAAIVAAGLRISFPRVQIVFVVGICGAVPIHPETQNEIVLGDCMISTAVKQFDFGRLLPHGFNMKDNVEDSLGRANIEIRSLIAKLKTQRNQQALSDNLAIHLKTLQKQRPSLKYLGVELDRLYESSYNHRGCHGITACDGCFAGPEICSKKCESAGCSGPMVERQRLKASTLLSVKTETHRPGVHLGTFGSANTVMKSGLDRDRIAKEHKLIAFEMEGSGVWDTIPTIIIKSACDYADSHKNKVWQPYAAAVAAAGLKAVVGAWDVSDEDLLPFNDKYTVQFSLKGIPMSAKFVNRPAEMQNLEDMLLPSSSTSLRKISVLHGLGGIGKTQLAVHFMRTHQAKFSAVFWLDGSNEDSLKRSIAGCAIRISPDQLSDAGKEYASSGKGDIAAVVEDVLRWFALPDNDRWLIICDNVDREYDASTPDSMAYDIETYIPTSDHGSILITTRLVELGQLGGSCELGKASLAISRSILESWYKKAYDATEGSRLLDYLDGLPLAIAQAGAFLQMTGMNITTYLRHYEEQQKDIEKLPNASIRDYANRSVWTTWNISYEAILARNEHAAHLLILWSFLDRNDLWHGIFEKASSRFDSIAAALSNWIGGLANSRSSFLAAMSLLRSYSLVEGTELTDGYSMHTVVHQWVRFCQGKPYVLEMEKLTLFVVGYGAPTDNEYDQARLQRRLLSHAQICSTNLLSLWPSITQDKDKEATDTICREERIDIFDAVNRLSYLYSDQGMFPEAEKLRLQAMRGIEETVGPKDKLTINTIKALGYLYRIQGKYESAERTLLRALQICEEAGEPKDLITLDTINALGLVYEEKDAYPESEKMYTRALKAYTELLGLKDSLTLGTVNHLGVLYEKQGKLAEAEKMYTQALQGYEATLGPKHPSTLGVFNNLGILYMNQKRFSEAAKMYDLALKGKEEKLGSKHPSTLKTFKLLGALYWNQGNYPEAEKIHLQALPAFEEALGPNHMRTLDIVELLGHIYMKQNKLDEAETMYLQALRGYEDVFGLQLVETHDEPLALLFALGMLYLSKKPDEAKAMLTRALTGYTIAKGTECEQAIAIKQHLDVLNGKSSKSNSPAKPFQSTEKKIAELRKRLRRILK